MGTYGGYSSRAELVAEVTKSYESDTIKGEYIAKKFSGNDLWTVLEITRKDTGAKERVIYLFKISRRNEFDWCYKPMEESTGPFTHSCPLSFLAMVPEPERPEGYHDWRAGVRQYHAARNQKVLPGMKIKLTNGRLYEVRQIEGKKIFGRDVLSGDYVRIPRGMLVVNAEVK